MKKNESNQARTRSNAALIWGFLRGSKGLFLLSVLSAAVTALADMINPQIIRAAVDKRNDTAIIVEK